MIPLSCCTRTALRRCATDIPRVPIRHKSLQAAIERGASVENSRDNGSWSRSDRYEVQRQNRWNEDRHANRKGGRDGSDRSHGYGYSLESLPYSSAASEFLYGYSSVFAALKAGRRKFYKLYVHETRGLKHHLYRPLISAAKEARVFIHIVKDKDVRLLDKASSGRPHNGFVLETSPLPRPPIVSLSAYSKDAGTFRVQLDKQTREEREVNGTATIYKYKAGGWRFPFVMYVDGVLNEGNLGAIARSAYFLGVDAIITPTWKSAPWDHVAVKASAGAAEAIPIFAVNQPAAFLTESAREGWRIYASDAINENPRTDLSVSRSTSRDDDASSAIVFAHARQGKRFSSNHSPVATHPTILMMGSEDTGLPQSLLNVAHYKVAIRSGRQVDEVGVDSLNVSVAASLLALRFLEKPSKTTPKAGNSLF
ncbi:alpha/beta knot [Sporormia fimetaria CBS 119925]|uniref:rRNA methyltransferase 1, mitochondrial n=1 Tax=Sporormia fimetaria CBS 119925 TaxID=1340428 RepID=A0A6A6VKD5_9PLEO|nr:alpha/beta knot [Sporormia fimetaria CBS 119925]